MRFRSIQIQLKGLTKAFVIISNWKNPFYLRDLHKYFQIVRVYQ